MIDDRVERHGGLVEAQRREGPRIGTPPVAAEVTPPVDLFLVHPVENAVEDRLGAVLGEPALASAGEIEHPEVVLANERELRAVGAEGRYLLVGGRAREALHRSARRREQVEVPLRRDEDPLAPLVERVARLARRLLRGGRGNAGGRQSFLEALGIEQRALALRLHVEDPPSADRSPGVDHRPRESVAREPLQRLRPSSFRQVALLVIDGIEGHGDLLGSGKSREGEGDEQKGAQQHGGLLFRRVEVRGGRARGAYHIPAGAVSSNA